MSIYFFSYSKITKNLLRLLFGKVLKSTLGFEKSKNKELIWCGYILTKCCMWSSQMKIDLVKFWEAFFKHQKLKKIVLLYGGSNHRQKHLLASWVYKIHLVAFMRPLNLFGGLHVTTKSTWFPPLGCHQAVAAPPRLFICKDFYSLCLPIHVINTRTVANIYKVHKQSFS